MVNAKITKVYIYKNRMSKHGVHIPYQLGSKETDFIARRNKDHFANREAMMRHILTPDEYQQWLVEAAFR